MINANRAMDLYEKAKNEIEEKRFEEALLNLQKAMELNPDFAEALSLIGYVHYKLKFRKKTKKEVFEITKRALELDETSQEVWFQMGNANSHLNRFNEAIECYNKAHKLGYDNEKLYNNLGSAFIKKGDFDNALKYYNEGLKFKENFSPLLNNLGYYYLKKGELDKALYYLEKAMKMDPTYSAPLTNMGNIYSEKGEFKKALKYYNNALKIDPDDSHAINNLGATYYALKNYEEAIKYYEKSIEIDSDYGAPWMNLGAIYSEKSDYTNAIRNYDKALELDSTLFKAWYNKGNAYCKLNDIGKAISSYNESIKIDASYFPAWSNLGAVYSKIKKFAEAEECFKKAIDLNPNSTTDLFNLGNLYRFKGDFKNAIIFFQKAIELDSNNGSAWYNQGISYLMMEDFDMAISCLEEAKFLLPQNPGIRGNLGMAYEGKLDHKNAFKCFFNVLKINPNDVLALTTIGQIYIKDNRFDKAIPFLKKALEIKPIPIIQIDNLGYEVYYLGTENAYKIKENGNNTFPFTPDIYASIGMAYHQLGNDKEALENLNLAIKLDPDNFIGYANLGIFFLNKFDFSKALVEINKAINIIKEKRLKQELEKVDFIKKFIEKAMLLRPGLKLIDEQITRLVQVEKVKNLINPCSEIKNSLNDLIRKINLERLPIITKNLLLAKLFVFDSLYNILTSTEVDSNEISNVHNLFSSKTEFNKFFFSFQNFKDIMNLIKGYSDIVKIPEIVTKIIHNKITVLESLGSELSDVITGSIVTMSSFGELSPLTESRIIHSGVENTEILKSTVSSDRENDTISDSFDLLYLKQVCEELHNSIPRYKGKNLEKSDFIEFLRQFPESLRFTVAKMLKRIKFINFEEMGRLILNEFNNVVEEPKNTYFISFKNGWQKSQDTWSYFTQKLSNEHYNKLKIEDLKYFLSKIKIDQEYTFIFLDDLILTGSQFKDFFEDETIEFIDDIEEIKLSNENVHFYIVAGLGSFISRKYISQNINLFEEDSIRFGHTIKERDQAFYHGHYPDSDIRDDLISFLKKKHPLEWNGYRNSQCLVILEWNTPDNTIGCLRKNTNGWRALFPRN